MSQDEKRTNSIIGRSKRNTSNMHPQNQKDICFIHNDFDETFDKQWVFNQVCLKNNNLYPFNKQKYCLFHLPNKNREQTKLFEEEIINRLDWIKIYNEGMKESSANELEPWQLMHYDFSYIHFPITDMFFGKKFESDVSFKKATFLSLARFSKSEFLSRADFSFARFKDKAIFDSVKFHSDTVFNSSEFYSYANFSCSNLEANRNLYFKDAKIYKILSFSNSTIKGSITFEGGNNNNFFIDPESSLDIQNVLFEEPRKIYFNSVRIEPNWFLHADCKNFNFTDCKGEYTGNKKKLTTKIEIRKLLKRNYKHPNAYLAKTCWQLADNHEESKDFEESSKYRKIANEAKRLEKPWYLQPLTLHWYYYIFSFYGEKWWLALIWLLGIIATSGIFYEWYGVFQTINSVDIMSGGEGYIYSLYVAALQRPEPKAVDGGTKILIILETIFVPLQAALLALAIRRKFMR